MTQYDHSQELKYYRNVVMRYISEYLDLRVAHLCRVRPALSGHLDDLTYQVKVQVEDSISVSRPFAGTRAEILDLLIGDDLERRRTLLIPTDQNTLINDFIEDAEDKSAAKTVAAPIKGVRSLYGRIDPELEDIVETLQTLVWLDFPDVIFISNIEVSLTYLMDIIKNRAVSDKIRGSVNYQLNRPLDRELALEEALLLHYHRCVYNLKQFAENRKKEGAYMQIIRREVQISESDVVNKLIMKCATHIHNAQQIANAGTLSDDQRAAYAKAMVVDPATLKHEAVVQYERKLLMEARNQLATEGAKHSAAGPPVNHKPAQLRDMTARFEQIVAALKQAGVDLEKPAPVRNPEKEGK